MYHYQKSKECCFLEIPFKSFFLVRLVSSFRWLHYWHFYQNYVTKPFPEMLIDRYSKNKTALIKEEASDGSSTMHTHMYACMHARTHAHKYTHTHTNKHTHVKVKHFQLPATFSYNYDVGTVHVHTWLPEILILIYRGIWHCVQGTVDPLAWRRTP